MRTFDLRSDGATGDGRTLDTDAMNRGVLPAAATGGGTRFVSARHLSLGVNSTEEHYRVLQSKRAPPWRRPAKKARFDAPEPNEWGDKFRYRDFGHSHWQNSLVWGVGLDNISILGPGLIHGKGLDNGFNRFADESKGEQRHHANNGGSGNKAIALQECHNVVLRDFSILQESQKEKVKKARPLIFVMPAAPYG